MWYTKIKQGAANNLDADFFLHLELRFLYLIFNADLYFVYSF